MAYILDTTVLVDIDRRFAPTLAWMARQVPSDLYLSAVTVGELVRGACKRHRNDPLARDKYLLWLRGRLATYFPDRILAFDHDIAEIWGRLMDDGAASGNRPPLDDAKIAATALHHGLTVATSNTRQMAPLCPPLDPRTA